MCPRYGRNNKRYNVKAPKRKMPREKILALQSIASIVILLVMIPVSFFAQKDSVSSFLYTTYSPKGWQKALSPVTNSVRDTSTQVIGAYIKWVSSFEKKFGIDAKTKPVVKAQNSPPKVPEPEVVKTIPPEAAHEEPPVRWQLPLWGKVTSPFGERTHPISGNEATHTGIDIAGEEGKTVVCASEGTVSTTGFDDANGNYITVSHPDNITTIYAHLAKVCVNVGDIVSPDIKIGEVGSTGISTGPHLHFEIKENGVSVDPAKYVYFEER